MSPNTGNCGITAPWAMRADAAAPVRGSAVAIEGNSTGVPFYVTPGGVTSGSGKGARAVSEIPACRARCLVGPLDSHVHARTTQHTYTKVHICSTSLCHLALHTLSQDTGHQKSNSAAVALLVFNEHTQSGR